MDSPAALVTVKVKVVFVFKTPVETGIPLVTAPIPGVISPEPKKVAFRVVLEPGLMEDCAAVKLDISGGATTVTVVLAVTVPPFPVTVRV